MRVEFLESFLRFVTACQAEIQCCAIPVRRLIARHKDDGKTWALCHAFCEQGEPFHQAWKNAVLQGSKGQGVSKKDVQLLLDFGDTLGESETESQLLHCALTIRLVEEQLSAARAERAQKAKLYSMLGMFGGAAFVLVLL